MSKQSISLSFAVVAALATTTQAATLQWNGGTSTAWSDAANWQTSPGNTAGITPGSDDVAAERPTWMTLSCGVNDVMHKAVELEDYKAAVTAILDRCQQAGVKVVVLTATQIGLPVTNPANVKLAGDNDLLRETAKVRNLPLADVNAAMVAEQASLERAAVNSRGPWRKRCG